MLKEDNENEAHFVLRVSHIQPHVISYLPHQYFLEKNIINLSIDFQFLLYERIVNDILKPHVPSLWTGE